MARPVVVIGFLGTVLDAGRLADRWERWRPTVGLCSQSDFAVDRLELFCPTTHLGIRDSVVADLAAASPETRVVTNEYFLKNPWDFEEVFAFLLDWASGYPFDPEKEDYYVHITTGTHVAQICLFLLTETRRFPAKLIQTSPARNGGSERAGRSGKPLPEGFKRGDSRGALEVIDLDLSRYSSIAARFERELQDRVAGLKSGIETRNAAFNRLIQELEHVAAHATDPILLMGPTGAGKSHLARRIFDLKRTARQVTGGFVEVNCATLRGDTAMSTLFGHKKGAFTGAAVDRSGLLRSADGGVLFLDEVGELGLDEQAMLLRALEEKRFLPVGSDEEVRSAFQLIAGTNRDLSALVRSGAFREDLLARMNLWTFTLPPLRERREDIEPNLEYELDQFAKRTGRLVRMSREARSAYVAFATSPRAAWTGNFRDLAGSVTRLCTLAPAGRVEVETVQAEIARLEKQWGAVGELGEARSGSADVLQEVMGAERVGRLDRFDRVQLEDVVLVCRACDSLSSAGRLLFAASREERASVNDADRLRKYLARFGLTFAQTRGR